LTYLHIHATIIGMDALNVQKTADFLKALGEFNRLMLVYRLCKCPKPQNTMCLCECCNVDASVVSRHLKVLADRGVVSAQRNGREKTYSLNRKEVAKNLRELADQIEGEQPIHQPTCGHDEIKLRHT